MDFSEKWGTSVENAVELALIDLRLSKEQVEIIVLEEPSKGFFGIGSKLAKVRVEKKAYKPERAKTSETKKEVVVDAENYRQKREKTLEQLANRLASKVIKSRKSVRLEPMNPYERKVIHATLQSNPEVTTRSEGEEPYRRVIIDLK